MMENTSRLFNGKSHLSCPQCGQRLALMELEEIFELLRGDEPELERVLGSAHAWRCRNCVDGTAIWTDEELLAHFHPNEARVMRRVEEEEADTIMHSASRPPAERDYDADAYMNWFGDSEDEEDEDLLEDGFVILEDLIDEPDEDEPDDTPR